MRGVLRGAECLNLKVQLSHGSAGLAGGFRWLVNTHKFWNGTVAALELH